MKAEDSARSEKRRTSSPLKDRQDKKIVKMFSSEFAAMTAPIANMDDGSHPGIAPPIQGGISPAGNG